jgi:hypothetical protein
VFACEDAAGGAAGEDVVKLRSKGRGGFTGLLFDFVAASPLCALVSNTGDWSRSWAISSMKLEKMRLTP